MSKIIKQMQMDAMKKTFGEVKSLVVLSQTKLSATAENQLRLSLRKKNVLLHQVKNSLARKVFDEIGIPMKDVWGGSTVFAWGPESVKDLSKTLEATFNDLAKKDPKFKEKVTVKTAVADGQQITFAEALKMPTRLEAIGEIVGMVLGPGSQIAAILQGPGGQLASQVESRTKETAAAA